MNTEPRTHYEARGYALLSDAISPEQREDLLEEVDRVLRESSSKGGARNLLHRSERLAALAEHGAPSEIARRVLGSTARPTKLTLFDKSPSANWLIRWHQDLTIAVRERLDVPGFSGWSVKDGVTHVRPPIEILEGVLAIRLHLDDTPENNGALRVLPGSHRLGRLDRDEIRRLRREIPEVVCEVPSRGAMLMSPLLLHASSKASNPKSRRVLHFELSARPLPGALEWA